MKLVWECDHSEMEECCEGCGHYSCECGIVWIVWDEVVAGPGEEQEEYEA